MGKLYVLFGDSLHLGGRPLNLRTSLFIGGGHMRRQQMTQRINRRTGRVAQTCVQTSSST